MNKSGPLQIISKLVTSARLLMHLLWSSLPSQWWDLGHSVHREERQLAPIWALLSSLNTKHILKSKQKKNATASLFVFAQLLCIEICQSSPLQHATQARTLITSHTFQKETENYYEHSIRLSWTGWCCSLVLCASKNIYCRVSSVMLKLQETGRWQWNWNGFLVDGVLKGRREEMTHPCKYNSQDCLCAM